MAGRHHLHFELSFFGKLIYVFYVKTAFVQINVLSWKVHRSTVSYQPLNQCQSKIEKTRRRRRKLNDEKTYSANIMSSCTFYYTEHILCVCFCAFIAIFIEHVYLFIVNANIICHINMYVRYVQCTYTCIHFEQS